MSFKRHLTAGIALTVGLVALTGSALAAPPTTPPGQEKKAEKQAEQAATAPAQSAPADANNGQEQKAANAESSTGINATTAGVKPSNDTDKNTSCKTGGSGSSTTCTRSPHGTNPPDSSKRYGNGTTAAQIATSRNAPAGTEIRGPGNSQPHKVCGKNGHFIDVHAVKSYVGISCTGTAGTTEQSQATVTTSCPAATTTSTVVGVLHNDRLKTNDKSAHFTKHGDDRVTVSATVTATGTCGTASTGTSADNSTNVTSSTSLTGSTTGSTTGSIPGSATGSAVTGRVAGAGVAGGVAGVATESGSPQSGSNGGEGGGVLGAFGVAGVAAGGVLPFTGFPLWLAFLIAIGLIVIGWTLYRRGRPTSDLA